MDITRVINYQLTPQPDQIEIEQVPLTQFGLPGNVGLSIVPIQFTNLSDQAQILKVIAQVTKQFAVVPQIRELAIKIGNPQQDNDVINMRHNIVDWVRQHMQYVPDPTGEEYVITPAKLLGEIRVQGYAHGDCDDHVVLLNTLLNSVGIPAIPIAVKINGSPIYNHVITAIQNPDGTLTTIDPCVKNGNEPYYRQKLVLK